MPYKAISELPDNVRNHVPKHAQEIYKKAFNSAWDEYSDKSERRGNESREEVAHKATHVRLVGIGSFHDLEADAAKRLGNETTIGERARDRSFGVGRIPDDQRDALLGRRRKHEEEKRRQHGEA